MSFSRTFFWKRKDFSGGDLLPIVHDLVDPAPIVTANNMVHRAAQRTTSCNMNLARAQLRFDVFHVIDGHFVKGRMNSWNESAWCV